MGGCYEEEKLELCLQFEVQHKELQEIQEVYQEIQAQKGKNGKAGMWQVERPGTGVQDNGGVGHCLICGGSDSVSVGGSGSGGGR